MKAAYKPIVATTLACWLVLATALFAQVHVAGAQERPPQPGEVGWQRAVRLRTQLEASPVQDRTAERFQEVMDAFRTVYRMDPNIAKAPAAVAAVADLLVERGRLLHETGSLRAAMLQYELLRKQYPRSEQVRMALLLEAEICRQDLKDMGCAEQKLRAVMAAYPGTSFAEQAEIELRDLGTNPVWANKTPQVTEAVSQTEAPVLATPTEASGQNGQTGQVGQASEQSAPPASAPVVLPAPVQVPASRKGMGLQRKSVAPIAPAPEGQEDSTQSAQPDSAASGQTYDLGGPGGAATITGIRHWSNPTSTRIAIDLSGKVSYEAGRVPNPDRIYFDLHGTHLSPAMHGHPTDEIADGFLKRIRSAQFKPDVTRVVLDVNDVWEYSAFLLPNPWRLIIDVHGSGKSPENSPGKAPEKSLERNPEKSVPKGVWKAPMSGSPASKAGRDSVAAGSGTDSAPGDIAAEVASVSRDPSSVAATHGPTSRPMASQVGTGGQRLEADAAGAGGKRKGKHAQPPRKPRIVIDAGHGGHDSGTLGPGGIEEKDVVLDVALRTGTLLQKRLCADVIYTRSDDSYVPLETRTAIANKAEADLFLSIHGNSSPEPSARGVETYYLNFAGNLNAVDIAARENALSDSSVHQLSDLVRKITLKEKIDQSRTFAMDVDRSLFAGLKAGNSGLKDRGAKRAPFVVLIGAQMPSVLAEISFLTNPKDARKLAQANYRQRVAGSLEAGVEQYLKGMKAVPRAVRMDTATKASPKADRNLEVAVADGQRGGK